MAELSAKVWMPMDSAPRNCAGILALLPDSNFPVGVRFFDGRWCVAWDNSPLGEHDQPRMWMHIPDEDATTLSAQPAVLAEIWRALDSTLGDTDPDFGDMSDTEIREENPVWWATRELRALIDATPAQHPPAEGVALPAQVAEWTDQQCIDFACVAFRHAPKNLPKGVELNDIRMAAFRVMSAAAPQPEAKPVNVGSIGHTSRDKGTLAAALERTIPRSHPDTQAAIRGEATACHRDCDCVGECKAGVERP